WHDIGLEWRGLINEPGANDPRFRTCKADTQPAVVSEVPLIEFDVSFVNRFPSERDQAEVRKFSGLRQGGNKSPGRGGRRVIKGNLFLHEPIGQLGKSLILEIVGQ